MYNANELVRAGMLDMANLVASMSDIGEDCEYVRYIRATAANDDAVAAIVAKCGEVEPIGEIKLHVGEHSFCRPYRSPKWLNEMTPTVGTKLYAAPVIPAMDEERERALLSVVESVAAEGFHAMPRNEGECKCSRCKLIREARAALREGN